MPQRRALERPGGLLIGGGLERFSRWAADVAVRAEPAAERPGRGERTRNGSCADRPCAGTPGRPCGFPGAPGQPERQEKREALAMLGTNCTAGRWWAGL